MDVMASLELVEGSQVLLAMSQVVLEVVGMR